MTRVFRPPSLYLLFTLSIAYALTVRQAPFSGGTVPGVLLATTTNLQLVCVVFLGWWLLTAVLTVPDTTAPTRLLRYGSYTHALFADVGRCALWLAAAAVATVSGALLAATGLPARHSAGSVSPAFQVYANVEHSGTSCCLHPGGLVERRTSHRASHHVYPSTSPPSPEHPRCRRMLHLDVGVASRRGARRLTAGPQAERLLQCRGEHRHAWHAHCSSRRWDAHFHRVRISRARSRKPGTLATLLPVAVVRLRCGGARLARRHRRATSARELVARRHHGRGIVRCGRNNPRVPSQCAHLCRLCIPGVRRIDDCSYRMDSFAATPVRVNISMVRPMVRANHRREAFPCHSGYSSSSCASTHLRVGDATRSIQLRSTNFL